MDGDIATVTPNHRSTIMTLDQLLELLDEIERINQDETPYTFPQAITQTVIDDIATARKHERIKLADAEAKRLRDEDPIVYVDDDGICH
jgi:hypothetical protein